MLKINVILQILFILLLNSVHVVFSQVYTNPVNGHTYEYIAGKYSWTQAQALAAVANPPGYLATITTQSEYEFIVNSVLGGVAGINYGWIGSHSNDSSSPDGSGFKWRTGPEVDLPMYDRKLNKCFSFCAFLPYQPDIPGLERYVHFWSSVRWNDVVENWSDIQGYYIERGGLTDPYMIPPDTDDKYITFKNLVRFRTSTLSINAVSLNGKTNFQCVVTSYDATSATCTKPVSMTGEYDITIGDGLVTPFVLKRVHPTLPYVSSIVPAYTQGATVTISGESFGDKASEVTVYLSSKLIACNQVNFIIPHRLFTCVLASTIYSTVPSVDNTYLDLTNINVNGIKLVNATRVPHINVPTQTMFSFTSNDYGNQNGNLMSESKVAQLYTPFATADQNFIMPLFTSSPQVACFKYNVASSAYTIQQGPNAGYTFISSSGQCSLPSGCALDPSYTTNNNSLPMGYLIPTRTFYALTSTVAQAGGGGGCRYIFSFIIPQGVTPVFTSSQVYRVPTKGGIVTVPISAGIKMTYSAYAAVWGGASIASQIVPVFRPNPALDITFPVGTGIPKALSVSVDGLSSGTSVNPVTVGYIAPSISKVTIGASTAGQNINIEGDNFGDTISKISVTITPISPSGTAYQCGSISIVENHTKLQCTLASGTGTYSTQVSVDGQNSNTFQSTYAIPSITSVTQNGVKFTMVATDMGDNLSQISITMGSIPVLNEEIIFVSAGVVSFNLSTMAVDASFVLNVSGQASSPYPFFLTPFISSLNPTYNGGQATSFGYYFGSVDKYYFGGVAYTTFTINNPSYMVLEIPQGTGLDIPAYFTTSTGKTSNIFSYYYLQTIQSTSHNGTTLIYINGLNFWPGTMLRLPGGSNYNVATDYISINQLSAQIPLNTKSGSIALSTPDNIIVTYPQFKVTPLLTSVSSVTPTGGLITITGQFLSTKSALNSNLVTTVAVGTYPCTTPATLAVPSDNTKLTCTMPPGQGSNLYVNVTINGISNLGVVNFAYNPPAISTVVQTDQQIVITGSNYGAFSQVVVTLGSNVLTCTEVTVGSVVSCTVPITYSSGNLVLSAGGQLSSPYPLSLKPKINSMSLASASATAITLSGEYFRNSIGDVYSGTVGSASCLNVKNIANTDTIECTLASPSPVATSAVQPLVTITIGSKSSNSIPFSFAAPTIATLTQQNSPTILIVGDTLGNTDSPPVVTLSTVILTCEFTVYQSTISCQLPLTSTSGSLVLSNYGSQATKTFNLTPKINAIAPVVSGGTIEITGYFLGEASSVTIGPNVVSSASITIVDQGKITFTLSGSGVKLSSFLTSTTGQISNTQTYSFGLEFISVANDYTTNKLILKGKSFDTDSIVFFNSQPYDLSTTNISSLEEIIQTVPLSLTNGDISVQSNSQTLTLPLKLTPVISSMTSVPTTGGQVTVSGYFLNLVNSNGQTVPVTIQVGTGNIQTFNVKYTCTTPTNNGVDNLSILCQMPPGTGTDYFIKISIDGIVTSTVSHPMVRFSYGLPSISSVTQNANSITIQGNNFGNDLSKVSVTLNGITLSSCQYVTSHTSISCPAPQSSSSGPIIVTVDTQPSTPYTTFKFTPIINSMTPALASDTVITVSGYYFRSLTSAVYQGSIGSHSCSSIRNIPNTDQIECTVQSPSPVLSSNQNLLVTVIVDSKSSNSIAFAFGAPSITSTTQNHYYSVEIVGMNLGNSDSVPQVSLDTVTLSCTLTTVQTTLNCTLPATASSSSELVVSVYSQSDNYQLNLQPVLSSITSASSGGEVNVNGYFLTGTKSITIGATISVTSYTLVDPNHLKFNIPAGTGINLQTTITTNQNIVSTSILYSYLPQLTSYIHSGTASITLIGNNFDTDSLVTINSVQYPSTDITQLDQDKIILVIPTGLLNGNVYVTSHSAPTSSISFKLTPVLSSITSAKTTGGSVTIFGNYLNLKRSDNNPTTVSVLVGSTPCTGVSPVAVGDNSKISCTMPSGSGSGYAVSVTIDTVASVGSATFSYGKPSITSISQNQTVVTISGESFGTSASQVQVYLNGVSLGAPTTLTDIQAVISVPKSSASGPVYLKVSGQDSNEIPLTLTPILESMTPSLSNPSSITLFGWYFNVIGNSQNLYKGFVGSQACVSVAHQLNDNSVVCALASEVSYTYPNTPSVTVEINSVSSNSIPYKYSAPEIDGVSQNLQHSLTLNGNNFGNLNEHAIVKLSGVLLDCNLTANSQLTLQCALPSTAESGSLEVNAYGLTDTYQVNLQPIITGITHVASGQVATITGFFLQGTNKITIGNTITITTGITIVDSNTVKFTVTGKGLNLQTTISNTVESNAITFSFLPVLTSYIHDGTPKLTLTGENFDSDSKVTINTIDYQASTTTINSATEIVQTIPSDLRNGFVIVTSQSTPTQSLLFKLTPTLSSVTSVPTSGGDITIFGSYLNTKTFDNNNTVIVVTVGTKNCPVVSSATVDNSKLVCTMPSGSGSNFSVSLSIDGVNAVGSVTFGYGKPSITSITQSQKTININGMNLGSDIADIQVELNQLPLTCTITTDNILLNCQVPQEYSTGPVMVTVQGQESNELQISLSPIIESMVPAQSNTQSIIISGWYFRSLSTVTYIGKIGSTTFISVTPIPGTDSLECNFTGTPAESNTTPSITITIDTLASLNSIPFKYSYPFISNVIQNQHTMIISGHSLGNSDSTPVVSFSNQNLTCNITSPQTKLTCSIPLSSLNSIVTVSNYGGSNSSDTLNLTPIITSVVQTTTAGGKITIVADYVNDLLLNSVDTYMLHVNNQPAILLIYMQTNIICEVEAGLPDNFTVTLTQNSMKSNDFVTNYLNPVIQSYSQDEFILTLEGISFGLAAQDQISLQISGQSVPCQTVVNHTKVDCNLESVKQSVESSSITIQRNSVSFTSQSLPVYLVPKLTSSTRAPVEGGLIKINGYFLNKISPSAQIPMSVNTTVGVCQLKSSNNLLIECTLGAGAHGVNNELKVTLNPVGSSTPFQSKILKFSAQDPTIIQIKTNGKFYYPSTGVITIQGTNFIPTPLATITIANKTCTNAQYISSRQYSCQFVGNVSMTDNYGLNVEIDCDSLKDNGDYFYYDQMQSCQPECTSNGQCVDGYCQCNEGYSGSQCQNTKPVEPEGPGTVDPGGAQYSSNLSVFFSHIREITLQNQVVIVYPVSAIRWNTSDVGDNPNEITSIGVFPNTNIKVEVKSIFFDQAETYYFAGERMDMEKNSLKYQVTVSGWPFNSTFNTLELIYALNAPSNIKSVCDEDIATNTTTSSNEDDLRYVEIQMNDKTFITKFSKRTIVDKRVTTINTKMLPKTDPIFQDAFYKNESLSNALAVSLMVPNFRDYVIIDPNFSLLINPNPPTSEDCETSEKKPALWWIAIVVVGAALLIAGAIVGVYYFKKRGARKSLTDSLSTRLDKIRK
ncbi:IPT/TIG domain-containing protein [Tieghemostelium lacteum]|uniref:IPT/TIG domain-containing protein n=1 Tax=Tieghemostelium lacteum TaxID=361077 RepID=A0A152A0E6_TIELA|nr:IPT/TIG domain-containing protein [Tieghemostelium lacteum]|eukprot:KYQ99673.1 IPT/TIG domain-containing protein [Tieghemostelium lacteum]